MTTRVSVSQSFPQAARGAGRVMGLVGQIALLTLTGLTATAAPAVEPGIPASNPRAIGSGLPGQLSSQFPIDYRDPEASVPSQAERNHRPLEFGYYLQDLLEQAEGARKKNDVQAVVRFYRAVAKAVPDNAKGWSKLCEAYEVVKDRDRAIRACKYAIDRPAAELQDYARYVHLILGKDGPPAPADVQEIDAVLGHLEKQGGLDVAVNHLRCEMGVKLADIARLERCTRALAKVSPDDPKTVVFEWSLAVQKGQRADAERLVGRAVKAGIVLEHIDRMRNITSSVGREWWGRSLPLALVATALLALLAGYVWWRRTAATRGIRQRVSVHTS